MTKKEREAIERAAREIDEIAKEAQRLRKKEGIKLNSTKLLREMRDGALSGSQPETYLAILEIPEKVPEVSKVALGTDSTFSLESVSSSLNSKNSVLL